MVLISASACGTNKKEKVSLLTLMLGCGSHTGQVFIMSMFHFNNVGGIGVSFVESLPQLFGVG